jgi:hypothetical protein
VYSALALPEPLEELKAEGGVARVKILRGMLRDRDGLPKVGNTGSKLGARPQYAENDIHPEDRIRRGTT